MHRHALATLLAVGALAASVEAVCPASPDTGFVKRITSYTASYRLDDSLMVQTVARNIPLDTLDAVGPIWGGSFNVGGERLDLEHVLQFVSPCDFGTYSNNAYVMAKVYDTTYMVSKQTRYEVTGRVEDRTANLEYSQRFTFDGKLIFEQAISIDKPTGPLYIGTRGGNAPFLSFWMIKVLTTYSAKGSRSTARFQAIMDSAESFRWVNDRGIFQPQADSVRTGLLDSARMQYQIIASEYQFNDRPGTPYVIPPLGASSSISKGARLRPLAQAIAVSRRLDGSWLIAGPEAAPVSIRTLNGRLVRELPAGNSVVWDGLDRAGRPVQAGVYLVEVRGVGHSRIPLAR